MTDMRRKNHRLPQIGLVWVVLAWSVIACSAKDPCLSDDPRDVVKQYLTMLDAQNTMRAFECLSQQAQDELAQRANAFNNDNPDNARKPADMLRAGHVIASTREYKKFEVQSRDASEAVVDIVMQDGDKIAVLLRRDGARWAVDLNIPGANLPQDQGNVQRIADQPLSGRE